MTWQLAGTVDLPQGDAEVIVRGHGSGQKSCDAVLISANAKTISDVERLCATELRLRQAPSPGQLVAVFDDGRRLEGNFVTGWHGSGVTISPGRIASAGRTLVGDGGINRTKRSCRRCD